MFKHRGFFLTNDIPKQIQNREGEINMHKMNLILGSTGSGKTVLVKKKIEENYKKYKEIFVLHYVQEFKLDESIENVTFFDSVEKMYAHIKEKEIENLNDILLVIDETRTVINPENASNLVKKFDNSIVTLQAASSVKSDEKQKSKVVEQFCLQFNLNKDELELEIEFVPKKLQNN